MNALNNGEVVAVTPNDVRFIFNARRSPRLWQPFGSVPRNYLRSIPINQLNLGLFRAPECSRMSGFSSVPALQCAKQPQAGFGITRNTQVPDIQLENAGFSFGTRPKSNSTTRCSIRASLVF